MFHMGGDTWKEWNSRLRPILIESQVESGEYAGSWEPLGDIPDAWGSFGGRLYVTTLNLLSLEVYYLRSHSQVTNQERHSIRELNFVKSDS